MKIGVLCESSSCGKNADIVEALAGRGHEIINIGMQNEAEQPALNYIHTSFMAGLLLHLKAVDFIVSGCGTGQGFAIAACQYPGVFCGQIRDPLDAWLFAQINNGNAVSLSLNKDYGWAGNVSLKFIFDALFQVQGGAGFPEHRRQVQMDAREALYGVSSAAHKEFGEIIAAMDRNLLKHCAENARFLDLVMRANTDYPARTSYLNAVGML